MSAARENAEPGPKAATVFISYSSRNGPVAEAVKGRLAREGIPAWFAPQQILAGNWPRQIVEAVRDCSLLLLILSEDSNRSEHVIREVALADQYANRMLAYEIELLEPNDTLKYYFSALQKHTSRRGKVEDDLEELVSRVRAALSLPAPVRPRVRAVSPFVRWNALAAFVLVAILAVWLHLFTGVGARAYLLPAAVVLGPLAFYNVVVPDFWRPWVLVRARHLLALPGAVTRLGMVAVNVVLALLAARTSLFGTLSLKPVDGVERQVWVFRGSQPGPAGTLKAEPIVRVSRATWSAHSPITVRVEGLPDKQVELAPYRSVGLTVPDSFRESPILLIVPDDSLRNVYDRGYRARITANGYAGMVDLAPARTRESMRSFWIGCAGTAQSLAALPVPQQVYPCVPPERLAAGDEVRVDVLTAEGEAIFQPFRKRIGSEPQQFLLISVKRP